MRRFWSSTVILSPLTHLWTWCKENERDWTKLALCCIISTWWNCWPVVPRAKTCTRKSSVTVYFRWMISCELSLIRIASRRWERLGIMSPVRVSASYLRGPVSDWKFVQRFRKLCKVSLPHGCYRDTFLSLRQQAFALFIVSDLELKVNFFL